MNRLNGFSFESELCGLQFEGLLQFVQQMHLFGPVAFDAIVHR